MTEQQQLPLEQSQPVNPCVACDLWRLATTGKPSASRGSDTPRLLIVGEAPGKEEDQSGFFFVGPTGQKAIQYLSQSGIPEDWVRWENVVRCAPFKEAGSNFIRTPTPEEINHCCGYLFQEIMRLQPEIIMPMGNSGLRAFLGKSAITRMRGRVYDWDVPNPVAQLFPGVNYSFKLLPTIHPAAVLRGNIGYESAILADMAHAKKLLSDEEENVSYLYLEDPAVVDMCLTEIEVMVEKGEVPFVAVDLETSSLNPWGEDQKIICYSISDRPGQAYCIPVGYSKWSLANDQMAVEAVKTRMQKFLSKVPVVGQNIKFDIKWSRVHAGADMPNIVFDTLLAAWALTSDTTPHDLEYLAAVYADMHASKQEMHEALEALPKEKRNMDNVPPAILNKYACSDADATLRVAYALWKELSEQGLFEAYKQLYLDMVVPFADIEYEGAAFTPEPLALAAAEYEEKSKRIPEFLALHGYDKMFDALLLRKQQESIKAEAKKKDKPIDKVKGSKKYEPHAFAISSSTDINLLFYEVLGLPVKGKTGKGVPSTTKDTVIEIVREVMKWVETSPGWQPVLDFLLIYQDLKKDYKMYTSYLQKLPKFADSNGRIHTTYNIGATATGRFSSADPSLHTLPYKSPAKKAFISRHENGVIVACDYSQIEMRVMALFSKDQDLLRVFEVEGGDVHLANASRLYKKPPEQITREERRKTKIASFGILYGQGAQGLSEQHHIPIEEAKQLIEDFYREFPHIKNYIDSQQAYVKEHGVCYTAFGARRIVGEARSTNKGELSKANRIAVNSPIQGTASQLTALAFLRTYWRFRNANMESCLFGFVHDEVAADVHPDELQTSFWIMRKEMMESPQRLYDWVTIPLESSFEIGVSWGHKIDVRPSWDSDEFTVEGEPENIEVLAETAGRWNRPFKIHSSSEHKDPEGKVVLTATLGPC